MAEESTTPDLVELIRSFAAAANRGDIEAMMSFFAPDAVWDNSPWGTGTFEGVVAIRALAEDWMGAYEEFEYEVEDFRVLGTTVVFAVSTQRGRPVGSTGVVQLRQGSVTLIENGLIAQVTGYPDIDEARAAAERLAEERG